MRPPPHPLHDPTPHKLPPNLAPLARNPTKKDPDPPVDIAVDDLGQDLGPGPVQARDAVHVEDDVLVVSGVADAGQGRVGGGGAVELEAAETGFQVTGVGEGEGFGDFDDEAAGDEFEAVRVVFGVFPFVGGDVGGVGSGGGGGGGRKRRDFAEDLDARFGAVADDGEEGEADAEGDAEGERVEDCGYED